MGSTKTPEEKESKMEISYVLLSYYGGDIRRPVYKLLGNWVTLTKTSLEILLRGLVFEQESWREKVKRKNDAFHHISLCFKEDNLVFRFDLSRMRILDGQWAPCKNYFPWYSFTSVSHSFRKADLLVGFQKEFAEAALSSLLNEYLLNMLNQKSLSCKQITP